MALIIFLAISLLLHGALGELVCEELPIELCSFSISSSGKRCLLEIFPTKNGENMYECKTSEVIVGKMQEWIESDECVSACGLDRQTIGISSDTLLQPQFFAKLCSNKCYQSCPNIVDLYFNLALGEGAYLPDMCANPRRALSAANSYGDAAPSPTTGAVSTDPGCAPSAAESFGYAAPSPTTTNTEVTTTFVPAPAPFAI